MWERLPVVVILGQGNGVFLFLTLKHVRFFKGNVCNILHFQSVIHDFFFVSLGKWESVGFLKQERILPIFSSKTNYTT